MNTNETQEIEIPAEWDVTVQAAERRGIRIGIEKMRDAAKLCNDARRFPAVLSAHEFEVWMNGAIDEMAEWLKEQGDV